MDRAEFDQYADAYDAQHAANIAITGEAPDYFAEYKVRETSRVARQHGTEPKIIVDFGSGIGNTLPHMNTYFPDAQTYAADVSEKSLQISERRFPGVAENLLIDRSIPLPDESVDLAFTACVFHHISPEEHGYWLTEVRRVLRKGGLFVLFEHNPLNPLTVHAVNTCPFDENAVLIRSELMKARFQSAGWETIETRFHVFFPGVLKWMRPVEALLKWLPLGGQYSIAARK
ncbi:class I SAM-dependent methyltransferase [Maricaulis sp.]|uniref:class I SAM-dependent methyltransferase n=1 Tax=Maricaulis sp. TaxID=1486257 RepID=UPI00262C4148|nr:class I SAM-dependent methyltransferase [Maricaulis sp.]